MSGLFGNLVDWFTGILSSLVHWLMAQASYLIQQVITLDQKFFTWVWNQLPAAAQQPLSAFQQSIQNGDVHHMVRVSSFFIAQVVDPTLLLICAGAVFIVWAIAVLLHFAVFIVGVMWSAPR